MIKKLLMGICILVALSLNVLAYPISSIRLHNEYLNAGDDFEMYVNLRNNMNKKLDDLRFRVFLLDYGYPVETDKFDISKKDKRTEAVFWTTPNLQRGEYLIKITAKNKDVRDVKYRYMTII